MTAPLAITRFVRPFHAGGSLPWLVEASDGAAYVAKLAGAGNGPEALLVELVVSAVAYGPTWPEILPAAPIWLDAAVPVAGTDEMWDVQRASVGWNLALPYLDGARELGAQEVLALPRPTLARLAALDTWFANLDRTPQSTNVLATPDGRAWFINHGSCRFLHRPPDAPLELPRGHLLQGRDVGPLPAPPPPRPLPPLPDSWLSRPGLTEDEVAARVAARLGWRGM